MTRASIVLLVTSAIASCGGSGAAPSSTPSPPSPSAASPSPPPAAEPGVNEGLTAFAPDLDPAEIPPAELVPDGADVTGRWFGFTDDGMVILITWVEPGGDVFRLPTGFAVWRRAPSSPHWRPAFVRQHPPNDGVLEIHASMNDVTGDGSDDAIVFEGIGGSGACGRWLVIDLLSLERTFAARLCDGRIDPGPPASPGLVISESVFRPGDAHCCPSALRETTLTWNGARWRVTDTFVTEP